MYYNLIYNVDTEANRQDEREQTMLTIGDVKREKAIAEIMQWDYDATGDLAPWDYDSGFLFGSAQKDIEAFVIETGWKGAAKDRPQEFSDSFLAWYHSHIDE